MATSSRSSDFAPGGAGRANNGGNGNNVGGGGGGSGHGHGHGHGQHAEFDIDIDQAVMLQDMARSSGEIGGGGIAGNGGGAMPTNWTGYPMGDSGLGVPGGGGGLNPYHEPDDGQHRDVGAGGGHPFDPRLQTQMSGYGGAAISNSNAGANAGGNGNGVPGVQYAYSLPPTQHHAGVNDNDMDPVELLEALRDYNEQQSVGGQIPMPMGQMGQGVGETENDHFASLLEAAATAGGHEAARGGGGSGNPGAAQMVGDKDAGAGAGDAGDGRGERKRASAGAGVGGTGEQRETDAAGALFQKPAGLKRKRAVKEVDEDQLAREREIWGPEDTEEDDEEGEEGRGYIGPSVGPSDARAVGVHSAAALFRRPSSASKKYTRPPMSKLFTSLELSPEMFLHLQAAAKAYMLDPAHPERSNCVGNRGRGDTDMVKLKLFGCVNAFLHEEGWGERCFGATAEGAEHRKLRWPDMKNKVISLVTPLLRRMVTNERQRQYANETRKAAKPDGLKGGKSTSEDGTSSSQAQTTAEQSQFTISQTQAPASTSTSTTTSTQQFPELDPNLANYHYEISDNNNLRPRDTISSNNPASSNIPAANLRAKTIERRARALIALEAGIATTTSYVLTLIAAEPSGPRVLNILQLTPAEIPDFATLKDRLDTLLATIGPSTLTPLTAAFPTSGKRPLLDQNGWESLMAEHEAEKLWCGNQVRIMAEVVPREGH